MSGRDYKSTAKGRGTNPVGGDSERLSDKIFAWNGVQAELRLHHGQITVSTKDYVDYLIVRSFLIDKEGYQAENVSRKIL